MGPKASMAQCKAHAYLGVPSRQQRFVTSALRDLAVQSTLLLESKARGCTKLHQWWVDQPGPAPLDSGFGLRRGFRVHPPAVCTWLQVPIISVLGI